MNEYGIFDIIGPIMIGPSSSHTAGAARLGKVARTIAGGKINSVIFLLHGSFAKTYKGHGTDRALVAGILGMEPSDPKLRYSLEIAKENGLEFEFKAADLGDVHPNTVKIVMKTEKGYTQIVGSSIGGGNVEVSEVNGEKVKITGAYPTLIISHRDVPGAVSKVTSILYANNINIAFMSVTRAHRGKNATMVFQCDNNLPVQAIEAIKTVESVENVISIDVVTEDN
ncbi:L-serine ammonia-lyase, iron-sulfur-dependent subunit beta [Inconstantimicrobium mannanitabidum]|uniref:L-serine dehydratase, iron-sulfur-dependent subunit beta n=1 Tax=Inconstantimicrobium mannanitabidum TaxID=1604901 RepID=A0ACB5RF43_9CLOT|nr:L-serine ammonia-lyase, iron-sulfur-dependent subunit beta [Clostridium sp. TW13]GKX67766.1 L-serine dehydratase, iron-sulfur-dependent subunit beta [Clostridium sp. TW13]